MSEIKESLKKIVLAGFGSAGTEGQQNPSAPETVQKEEEILSLLGRLPVEALKEIRGRLDGLIAATEEKAPEEAVESIKDACLRTKI